MKHLGQKIVYPLYMLLVALVVVACGGGGGGGGIIAGGGIGGTGVTASGAITGFGSIFVTENKFEIVAGTTTIEDDDNPAASESDLSIGMVVTVRATVNPDGTITADSVVFDADLEGPVSAVQPVNADGTERRITVLGTTVILSVNDTVYDDGPGSTITFQNVAVGDFVEVSGFFDEQNFLRASFIESKNIVFTGDATEVEVKGLVSGLGANSFTLGSLTVNFDSSTDLSDLPGSMLSAGQYVEVKGTMPSLTSTTLTATKIEIEGLDADEGETELEGIVTGFTDLSSNFFVAGQAVNASATGIVFEPANLVLDNGVEVEVEGDLSGGVLVADEVKLRGGSIEIETLVFDFDTAARTIELGPLGRDAETLTVRTDDRTRFDDVTLSSLAIGDFLEVEAFDDGSGNLFATRIKRESSAGDFILQGPADAAPATLDPVISILGVSFNTTGLGNDFEDEFDVPLGRGAFFARAEAGGELIKVKDDDPADGVPDEVEFEN